MSGKVVRLRQAKLFLMRPVAKGRRGNRAYRVREHLTEAEMERRQSRVPPAASLAAIPHRPDGRPSPARAETAAIVASTVKAGIAVIIPPAIIPVAWRIAWNAAD
jgi:hypothetical protein